jgi:hypothetical protein
MKEIAAASLIVVAILVVVVCVIPTDGTEPQPASVVVPEQRQMSATVLLPEVSADPRERR